MMQQFDGASKVMRAQIEKLHLGLTAAEGKVEQLRRHSAAKDNEIVELKKQLSRAEAQAQRGASLVSSESSTSPSTAHGSLKLSGRGRTEVSVHALQNEVVQLKRDREAVLRNWAEEVEILSMMIEQERREARKEVRNTKAKIHELEEELIKARRGARSAVTTGGSTPLASVQSEWIDAMAKLQKENEELSHALRETARRLLQASGKASV